MAELSIQVILTTPPPDFVLRKPSGREASGASGPLDASRLADVRNPVSIPLLLWGIPACGFTSLRKVNASWYVTPTAPWT